MSEQLDAEQLLAQLKTARKMFETIINTDGEYAVKQSYIALSQLGAGQVQCKLTNPMHFIGCICTACCEYYHDQASRKIGAGQTENHARFCMCQLCIDRENAAIDAGQKGGK